MFKKITLTVLGIIIGLVILVFAGFAWYPSLIQFQPEYKEASATCDSITVGMTYEEVKNKVGNLFFPEPITYMDNQGNGQAQLRNNVKGLDAKCFITFKDRKVTSATMMYGWL